MNEAREEFICKTPANFHAGRDELKDTHNEVFDLFIGPVLLLFAIAPICYEKWFFASTQTESAHMWMTTARQEAIVWWEIKRITMVSVGSHGIFTALSGRLFGILNGNQLLFTLSPKNAVLIQFITRRSAQKAIYKSARTAATQEILSTKKNIHQVLLLNSINWTYISCCCFFLVKRVSGGLTRLCVTIRDVVSLFYGFLHVWSIALIFMGFT